MQNGILKLADTDSEAASVLLDGALTVRNIASVRDILLAALTDHQVVRVDCRAADAVDLSCIQLLLAARQSASQAGKRLVLATRADGLLRATLEQGGFLGTGGGDPFWAGDT
jgi:anti-anti-sigma regulatory factor